MSQLLFHVTKKGKHVVMKTSVCCKVSLERQQGVLQDLGLFKVIFYFPI